MITNSNTVVVFDLDDTLYKEVDFLKSAYHVIANKLEVEIGKNIYEEMFDLWKSNQSTFDVITEKYEFSMTIKEMVHLYRFHTPNIELSEGADRMITLLRAYGVKMAIITDGRSKTQRNKLKALDVIDLFEKIIISEEIDSEKPSVKNFQLIEETFPGGNFFYIGDNFSKDFVTPNMRNWKTIGLLDNGQNIHKQDETLDTVYLPQRTVKDLGSIQIAYNSMSS